MADTPVITSSVVIATLTTADLFTLAPGLYAKLSPSHPFSAARGALQIIGWTNALEDVADLSPITSSTNPLGGLGEPEPHLTVWVYSTKNRRFRMSCDFVGGEQPTALKVRMPDGTEQVVDANALGFEFTTTSSGWHKFGLEAQMSENQTSLYTFHACEVTYLGPSE
jgi:hypothetical protein